MHAKTGISASIMEEETGTPVGGAGGGEAVIGRCTVSFERILAYYSCTEIVYGEENPGMEYECTEEKVCIRSEGSIWGYCPVRAEKPRASAQSAYFLFWKGTRAHVLKKVNSANHMHDGIMCDTSTRILGKQEDRT